MTERSLLKVTASNVRPVFTQTRRRNSIDAVYKGNWKLIRDLETGNTQLFDIYKDPGDLRDVSHQHPKLLFHLEDLLTQRLKEQELSVQRITPAAPIEFSADEKGTLRGLGYIQ